MTYARRVDKTQAPIVDAIRAIGGEVTYLYRVGEGVADLLVSWRQKWFVLECKSKGGEVNADQKKWIGKQRAAVFVVESPLEAINFLQGIKP